MKPLLSLFAVTLLAACDGPAGTAARMNARQLAVDPPRLWMIETVAPRGGPASYVCADTPMREGFARTRPEIDGAECRATARPVVRPGQSALRCQANGRGFAFSTQTRGDLTRDFELTVAVTSLDRTLGPAATTRRFRRLGACPAGWRIGDIEPRA